MKEKIFRALDGHVPEDMKEKVMEILYKKKEDELNKAPTIAIIGKTGVGKTSTLNALFGTSLEFSHTEACTQKAEPIVLTNGKGEIIVYDMPGLGEDEDKDVEHMDTYKKILPMCDVVLWMLRIDDREMSYQQTLIKQVLPLCKGRMVICANKADVIHPNDWDAKLNLPSNEQSQNLEKRIIDIRAKLSKVIKTINEDRLVYYSALKRYKLEMLFRAMMDACPDDRAWVLEERIDLADFRELMDQDILRNYNSSKKEQNG